MTTVSASIEERYAHWNTSGRDMHDYFNIVAAAKAEGELELLFSLTFESESRSSRLLTTAHVTRYCYLMDAGLEHAPERDEIVGVAEYVAEYYGDHILVMRLRHSLGLTDRQHEALELMRVHSFRQFIGPIVITHAKKLHAAIVEREGAALQAELAAVQNKHDQTISRAQFDIDEITGFYSLH